jgi:pimeloyl-ACP methyl ester carboxylesterase
MSCREAIGVPAGSALVEIDAVRLAVAREGKGHPVVCLHAIGHGSGDFAAFADAVKDRFEVIRVDWPGQGGSGPDREPASPARYAALLGKLLDRLGVIEPIIIGNSIGGAAAILHAARHPVRALVLCDSGGLVPVNALTRSFCGLFHRFFAGGARGAWWYRPLFALYYRMVLPMPAAAEQRRRIVAASVELAPLLAQAWASFGRPEADIRASAEALDAPIWFAWGRRDKVIPLSQCRPCIDRMKTATLTVFDAGHAAFLEQPVAFAEGLLAFTAV